MIPFLGVYVCCFLLLETEERKTINIYTLCKHNIIHPVIKIVIKKIVRVKKEEEEKKGANEHFPTIIIKKDLVDLSKKLISICKVTKKFLNRSSKST